MEKSPIRVRGPTDASVAIRAVAAIEADGSIAIMLSMANAAEALAHSAWHGNYVNMPHLTVAEIARLCESAVEGDADRVITGANSLEAAGPRDLSFVGSARAIAGARKSDAGCLLCDAAFGERGSWVLIRVPDPRRSFAQMLAVLYPRPQVVPGIHSTAVISSAAKIGEGCFVGPYSVIGENTVVGAHSYIDAHVKIGAGVEIGDHAMLHAHVAVYDRVHIGARVTLHSGCVIGADGFGYALAGDRYEKFPQVGTVVIEDDVEIGANCCIDRAALGTTRIGSGSKLDNMVHIAHNCAIGRHVVIAAQSGFAGGVRIGDYAVIGGQVGIGEKAVVAERAVVGSGAGILSFQNVAAGEPVWGVPARPLRQHLKGLANVGKISGLKERVRDLANRVENLEEGKKAE